MPFIPVFWVLLALQYTGYSQGLPRWFSASLFVIPIITVMLHFTNQDHHLFYRSLEVNREGPFPLAAITRGPWYHISLIYNNICMIAGNIIFYVMMSRSTGPLRKQAVVMFTVSLVPWIGNLFYQAGLSPYGIDIVPFTMAFTGPLFAVALFRFRMFDVLPIARGTVFDVMHDPVLVLDKYNRLADFNRAAGTSFSELGSAKIGGRISSILRNYPELARQLEDNDNFQKEIKICASNVARIFDTRLVPIKTTKTEKIGKLLILHDITSQRRLMDKLEELATKDGLTGINNRRHLMELSREEMERAKRFGHAISLILVDLDFFKKVNDRHGHQAGDEVLRNTAELLLSGLRSFDILGRYGGEEFALILPETNPSNGVKMAERLRHRLEKHRIPYAGKTLEVTASFGVSGFENCSSEVDLDLLLRNADKALYRAKNKGRNRVEMG